MFANFILVANCPGFSDIKTTFLTFILQHFTNTYYKFGEQKLSDKFKIVDETI